MKKLILLVFLGILLVSSCKKEDQVGDVLFLNGGKITGTIEGERTDGANFNEKFSFTQYLDFLDEQVYEIVNDEYYFYIDFSKPNGSNLYLEFTLPSATSQAPDILDFNMDYTIDMGDSLFSFSINNSNSVTLTDFSFDEESQKVEGKLTVTGTYNTTGNLALLEADLNAKLKKVIYK